MVRYLLPFLEEWILFKARKKVLKKFKRYIEMKNIELISRGENQEKDIYTLRFWNSENLEKGQVILVSDNPDESGAKTFQLMLTGTASVD